MMMRVDRRLGTRHVVHYLWSDQEHPSFLLSVVHRGRTVRAVRLRCHLRTAQEGKEHLDSARRAIRRVRIRLLLREEIIPSKLRGEETLLSTERKQRSDAGYERRRIHVSAQASTNARAQVPQLDLLLGR